MMDSLKIMEASSTIGVFIENLKSIMFQLGYDEAAVLTFSSRREITKTTTLAQLSVEEQMAALAARLGQQNPGDNF